MVRVKEVIVVEGRYDRNTLCQVVDADVLCTDGFAIFRDGERQALLRRLAEKCGLIVLTDPDGAGEVIRGFLSGIVPPGAVKHAFIPDIPGKEKRKSSPSKEGKLGVEGMAPEAILRALRTAGATLDDAPAPRREGVTPAALYALGLSGTPDSAERRRKLQKALEMPERMSTKQLLMALNVLFTPEELRAEMEQIALHEPVQQKRQGESAK